MNRLPTVTVIAYGESHCKRDALPHGVEEAPNWALVTIAWESGLQNMI